MSCKIIIGRESFFLWHWVEVPFRRGEGGYDISGTKVYLQEKLSCREQNSVGKTVLVQLNAFYGHDYVN